MTWFQVDDKLHDHRKARQVGTSALGLWTLAGSWSSDCLTDGFIPETVVSRWDRNYKTLAGRLVDADLWTAAECKGEQGWQFNDWAAYQLTKDKVLARREAAKKRKERGGSA